MIDNKKRELIIKFAKENDFEIILLQSPSFDNSIIGFSKDGRAIYDEEKMVDELANDYLNEDNNLSYSEAYTDAMEWISFNTLPSIGYMGDSAPIIINSCEEIFTQYED